MIVVVFCVARRFDFEQVAVAAARRVGKTVARRSRRNEGAGREVRFWVFDATGGGLGVGGSVAGRGDRGRRCRFVLIAETSVAKGSDRPDTELLVVR